jgi:hypothetical protein
MSSRSFLNYSDEFSHRSNDDDNKKQSNNYSDEDDDDNLKSSYEHKTKLLKNLLSMADFFLLLKFDYHLTLLLNFFYL